MLMLKTKTRKAAWKAQHSSLVGFQPPPRMTLPEWADEYRRLSASTNAVGGRWRTKRYEVARGPMMAASEKGVRSISIQSCTQLMKTSFIENLLGFHAHLKPCPMLFVLPKAEAVKAFSKERLAPMARVTPVLTPLLSNDRARGGGDTLSYREFPGGFLAMESAGSPTNLAMRAIQVCICDEIDKYEETREGDPVLLAEERTRTFKDRALKIRTSSPTWTESSRIHKSFLEGDQRLPFVACPHCEHEQIMSFFKSADGGAFVDWAKSEDGTHHPYTAALYCEACGCEWDESQRMKTVTTQGAIRWYQTKEFTCCDVKQRPLKTRAWEWCEKNHVGYAVCTECGKRAVSNEHASFTASQLYSPAATVVGLAREWVEWKSDPEQRQVFYNTRLGQPYEAQVLRKVEPHALATRRETYAAPVPSGVLCLTAGVDVQAGSEINLGRIEIEVVGWGLGEESWSIDHKVLHGDPARPDVWRELDDYLLNGFDHEGGLRMRPYGVCVDSGGHNTEEVYKFARARIGRNVWAIKGANDRSGQWSPTWPVPKQEPGKTRTTGYKPVILGVNSAKEAIRQRLLIEEKGPGYCHFPVERPESWFEQLTSENLMLEKKGGFTVRRWELPRGRTNEALDCRVYAYGALCGLYATRKLNLNKHAARIAKVVETLASRPAPARVAPVAPLPAKPAAPVDAGSLVRPARAAPVQRRSTWL